MFWDGIQFVARVLFKPVPGETTEHYSARLVQNGLIASFAIVLSFHIALACGRIPLVFPGFVTTTDFKTQMKEQADAEARTDAKASRLLEHVDRDAILEALRNQCHAMKTGDQDELKYSNDPLSTAYQNYRADVGHEFWNAPTCPQLGN